MGQCNGIQRAKNKTKNKNETNSTTNNSQPYITSFNSYPKKLNYENYRDNESNNNKQYNNNNDIKNNKNNSFLYNIIMKALEIHNTFRIKHDSKKLSLNINLCEIAQKYAEKCSETNSTDHYCNLYNNEIIGQNIEVVDEKSFNVSDICNRWYNEKEQYDFTLKKFNSKARHFTQLIWKKTELVGFGYSKSDEGKAYFVACYYPAGNILNKFSENVKK